MNTTLTGRNGSIALTLAVILSLASSQPAHAAQVTGNVKVFNYSPYKFRISGEGVDGYSKFDAIPNSLTGNAAPTKGSQTILQPAYLLQGTYEALKRTFGSSIRANVDVLINHNWRRCFQVLIYARYVNEGNMFSQKFALGTDQAKVGCSGGPDINWKTSQDDVEVVIDPQRTAWGPDQNGVNDVYSQVCKQMTPENRAKAPYCK